MSLDSSKRQHRKENTQVNRFKYDKNQFLKNSERSMI